MEAKTRTRGKFYPVCGVTLFAHKKYPRIPLLLDCIVFIGHYGPKQKFDRAAPDDELEVLVAELRKDYVAIVFYEPLPEDTTEHMFLMVPLSELVALDTTQFDETDIKQLVAAHASYRQSLIPDIAHFTRVERDRIVSAPLFLHEVAFIKPATDKRIEVLNDAGEKHTVPCYVDLHELRLLPWFQDVAEAFEEAAKKDGKGGTSSF